MPAADGHGGLPEHKRKHACVHTQPCPTLCDPMDYGLPGSSVHGILQARILEWGAISFSRGSSWPRDWTPVSWVSCNGRQILYHWATWEAQKKAYKNVFRDVVHIHNGKSLSHYKDWNWVICSDVNGSRVCHRVKWVRKKNKHCILTPI